MFFQNRKVGAHLLSSSFEQPAHAGYRRYCIALIFYAGNYYTAERLQKIFHPYYVSYH